MPELPALIGHKYRPVRLIGQGGMGFVYEVVHENTGEHLALKLLLARSRLAPDLVERFRREARATTSVKSDHVVRVTDADVAPELDGAPFLVMELLQGKNFEELCREHQPSPEETVDWLRQVARALDKAHHQHIVHRDLKPENLFLAEREDLPPIVKVLDFGIAKVIGAAGSETASGQILGTPRYMAPEQAGPGENEISPASDRYAFGLIAFRLLSKRHYFDQDNVMKLLLEVSRGPTLSPSALGCGLGPEFDAWFARACSLEPSARFESCSRQVEALAQALGVEVVLARTGESPRRNAPSDRAGPDMTAVESAPTLEASVVTGRVSRVGSSRRTLLLAGGVLGAGVLATAFGLLRLPSDAKDASTASAPRPSAVSASPVSTPPLVTPPIAEHMKMESSASAMPARAVPSIAPSVKRRPPPTLVVSARGGAPSTKPRAKPKDSVWDEP